MKRYFIIFLLIICQLLAFRTQAFLTENEQVRNLLYRFNYYLTNNEEDNFEKIVKNIDIMNQITNFLTEFDVFQMSLKISDIENIANKTKNIIIDCEIEYKRRGGMINPIRQLSTTFVVEEIDKDWYITSTDFFDQFEYTRNKTVRNIVRSIIMFPFMLHALFTIKDVRKRYMWVFIIAIGNIFGVIVYCFIKIKEYKKDCG